MLLEFAIGAGQTVRFTELADFFRLLSTEDVVDVRFLRQSADVVEATAVSEGYGEKFYERFDAFEITSATAQTIKFVTRLGNVVQFDAPPTGDVNVLNVAGAFAQAQKTVTNASGQLLASNAGRRYLLIQNNDPSGVLYVTLDGTAATTGKGVKISAGGSYECQGYVPTGAINAIGSIASNANVVAVEG